MRGRVDEVERLSSLNRAAGTFVRTTQAVVKVTDPTVDFLQLAAVLSSRSFSEGRILDQILFIDSERPSAKSTVTRDGPTSDGAPRFGLCLSPSLSVRLGASITHQLLQHGQARNRLLALSRHRTGAPACRQGEACSANVSGSL